MNMDRLDRFFELVAKKYGMQIVEHVLVVIIVLLIVGFIVLLVVWPLVVLSLIGLVGAFYATKIIRELYRLWKQSKISE